MKRVFQSFLILLLALPVVMVSSCNSGEKAEFWVRGNCDMCKERIEEALGKVEGVNSASWDESSGTVTVYYEPGKQNEAAWHKAVATVGHDTRKEKAPVDAYNNLPDCCKKPEDQKEKPMH